MSEAGYGALEAPEELVKYIAYATGLPEEIVRRVLRAERQYYFSMLLEM